MSVKNGSERNAKRGWIPLVLSLSAVSGAVADITGEAAHPQAVATVQSGSVVQADTAWDEVMRWLIQQLIEGLNCGSPTIPEDVPVAMLMTVDCYLSQGLRPMSPEERAEQIRAIDETLYAMQSAPSSVPLLSRVQFISTLKLMRAEAELMQ
jgi:hypothetical protein